MELHLAIREENIHLFKRSIRKLMESTFILREKDDKLYAYVSRESNRQDISEYLRMIGFDILVDDKIGVSMLISSEEDEETVGLKRANVVTFTTLQYHLLLVLWKVYLENLGYNEGNFVSQGELIDKIKAFGLTPVRTELNAAFKLFKKYSLIDYGEDERGEDRKIQLYPSLQFGWELSQFRAVAKEYIKEDAGESSDEEESDDSSLEIEGTEFEEDEL